MTTLLVEQEQMRLLWESIPKDERQKRLQAAEHSNTLAEMVKVSYGKLGALMSAEGRPIIIHWDGGAKVIKPQGSRFGHGDYAKFMGFGEDASSKLAKKVRKKLGKSYGGGFLVIRECGLKAGIYELRILAPKTITREGKQVPNPICSKFRAEIHQHFSGRRKVPVIVFPPQSGIKTQCLVSKDIIEVRCMTAMMKATGLRIAHSPAVMFGLIDMEKIDSALTKHVHRPGAKRSAKAAPKPGTLEMMTIKQLMVNFRRIGRRWSYDSIGRNIIVDRMDDVPGGRDRWITASCIRTWVMGTSFPCDALHEKVRSFLIRYRDDRESLNLNPAGERA